MRFLGLLLMLAAASAVPLSDVEVYEIEEAERHFEEFIQTFERNYETEEEKMMRLEVFTNNLKKINELNAKRTQEHQAVFGITTFADYTKEEFQAIIGGPLLKHNDNDTKIIQISDIGDIEGLPDQFDWRKKNKVTSVKAQIGCGSCWAFSATACVESAIAIRYNKTFDLAEQQLVDCDDKSLGCIGAFTLYAELSAAAELWGLYKKGIYEGDSDPHPHHAVLMVGYGIENGVLYWIIKNSWSTIWGEEGYIRLKAGENTCNIMHDAAATVTEIKLV